MLTADFEAGTAGSNIQIADPGSANAWDGVTKGTNASAVYDNAAPAHGGLDGKFATGATASVSAYCSWSTQWGTQTDHYGRSYIRLPAFPASTATTLIAFILSGSTTAGLNITSTGRIQLLNASGSTTNMTGTALSTNTWYRVEWHVVHNATTGSITANVYVGDSTTAQNTVSTTNTNTGTGSTSARFGLALAQAAANFSVYLDDIVGAAAAFPGPAGLASKQPAAVMSQAVQRAATRMQTLRRKSGILVPRLWLPEGATV